MWYKKAQLNNYIPQAPDVQPEPAPEPEPEPEAPEYDQAYLPPLHDNCRCQIVNMSDGTQHWYVNGDACETCLEYAHQFNSSQ
jgi:hypothetical protein